MYKNFFVYKRKLKLNDSVHPYFQKKKKHFIEQLAILYIFKIVIKNL